jgi:tungstate transport system substrate-binding protein
MLQGVFSVAALCWAISAAALVAGPAVSSPAPAALRTVRVAVIGGMNEVGFWDALAQRFEQETGIPVETVASGPKEGIAPVFRQGGVDLITMHASDTIINLVADGYALDPQPWARNDMVIVGPPSDPAGIKGMKDAATAIEKIVSTRSAFVVHSSLGAQEVLRNILASSDLALDEESTTLLLDDRQRRVLHIAAQKEAYTLVGRIPFRTGKIPNDGLGVMVSGDPRLRRPYVVAVANPARIPGVRLTEARRLAAFLRSPATQRFINEFGRGRFDSDPLFFPVWRDSTTQPSTSSH